MLLSSNNHFLNKLWNIIEKYITYVMLEQYHSLKCEEQIFSCNIINLVYLGLTRYFTFSTELFVPLARLL